MQFTPDDQFNPVFCPGCKTHIPRALSVSQTYCDNCLQTLQASQRMANQHSMQLRRQQCQDAFMKLSRGLDTTASSDFLYHTYMRAVARLKQTYTVEEVYAVNTGMGFCPQCGSHNLMHFRQSGTDDTSQQSLACCLGCALFWPLLLVAPFLKRRGSMTTHRQCNYCGWHWQV